MNRFTVAKAIAEKMCDDMDVDALADFFIEQQTNYILDLSSDEEIIKLANSYMVNVYEV